MKKILKFIDFVNELQTFVSDRSSTNRTKWIQSIHDEPTTNKSAASSILLKKKYTELEDKELIDTLNIPKWALYKIKKNPQKYTKLKITLNNLQFLKDQLKKGPLYCQYCNKGPLIIYDITNNNLKQAIDNPNVRFNSKFNPKDGATCDHKQPQSKGGDKFNYNNLAVSCYRCNRKKSNMNYEDWINFLQSDEGKNFIKQSNKTFIKKFNKPVNNTVNKPVSKPVNITQNLTLQKPQNINEFSIGDEVYVKGNKKFKLLGKISDILPNDKHPRKELSARIEDKNPNSLYSLNRLYKVV